MSDRVFRRIVVKWNRADAPEVDESINVEIEGKIASLENEPTRNRRNMPKMKNKYEHAYRVGVEMRANAQYPVCEACRSAIDPI